jgi:chemotaxis protein methyltransferase CheR
VTPNEYEHLKSLLKVRSGLTLSADKQYLLESRLLPVARKFGAANLADLVAKLRAPDSEPVIVEVVEAMTINETYFFRDKIPFSDFHQTIMPALLAARAPSRPIRIWCAAGATGQEPYSLAICLKEMGKELKGRRVEILATDLSNQVLERAKSGIYSQFEVQRGLPIRMLIKYFSKLGEMWQIAPEIRDIVKFMPFNLLNDFSHLGKFDLVFCRNVLIYFDRATKSGVLERLAGVTEVDGFLVLGGTESVLGLTERFVAVPQKHGLYVPRPASPASDGNVVSLSSARTGRAMALASR